MSYILDALKKVDRDSHDREGVRTRRALAISRARLFRRNLLWMSLIAAASAGLTAVLVSMLVRREPPPPAEASAAATLPASPPSSLASTGPPLDRRTGAAEPASSPKAPVPTLSDARAERADTEPEFVVEPEAVGERGERADDPEAEDVATEPAARDVEPAAAPVVPHVRVVGRESAALAAARPVVDAMAPDEPEAEAPANAPELVLQGTSVIDNKAVAVISDQRVFVGDFIQGAVVVRIGEREVELEFEGQRFKLRL